MSFGMEVYNEHGLLNFTTEKLLTHKVGHHQVTSRAGSFIVPPSIGDVWACHGPFGRGIRSDGMAVWVINDTVYWQLYFYQVSDGPVIQYGRYSL